ncbi:MAG: hypothetical protein GC131_05180 [Alphaproteobacteria bacterium]|nr:hypothetical protein [Alphaproteobacteria bacterium]
MGAKALDLFQGSDWTTYRASAAQAFDTLDRMQEACMPLMPQDMNEEQHAQDALHLVGDLSDDLMGELEVVTADLYAILQNNVAHRWAVVEMRMHLDHIRYLCADDHMASAQEHLAHTADLARKIKTLLKRIDQ